MAPCIWQSVPPYLGAFDRGYFDLTPVSVEFLNPLNPAFSLT
jgi:hypothetical protein